MRPSPHHHRARGKRSKYLYSICDDCGTNQQTGAFWQNRFKAHFPTIEASSKANKPVIPWLVNPKLIPNRLRTLSQKNPKASLKKHRKHCQTQAIKAAIVRQQELKRQREQAELNQASQPKPKKSRAHGKLSWLASLLGL
ncbi:hypothetical protein JCM19237_5836 [Photobacterium aphoticum]|uniref:Uncharacterized protein n=1 Tax=Photobacterium aphoticum TaxID=754436 RepID=A0A090QL19_9GAMM|nr:hypothetical protein JCM19237_5836 [Photobacterium aphoticum]